MLSQWSTGLEHTPITTTSGDRAVASPANTLTLRQWTVSYAYSSFYVEDGTYVRLRNLQLGYNVPARMIRWLNATRVYAQAENLFTITGYDGLDPSLPAANVTGAAGDIRDQYRGVDRGTYPTSRVFSLGISTSF